MITCLSCVSSTVCAATEAPHKRTRVTNRNTEIFMLMECASKAILSMNSGLRFPRISPGVHGCAETGTRTGKNRRQEERVRCTSWTEFASGRGRGSQQNRGSSLVSHGASFGRSLPLVMASTSSRNAHIRALQLCIPAEVDRAHPIRTLAVEVPTVPRNATLPNDVKASCF
jgi:hypothetical protein